MDEKKRKSHVQAVSKYNAKNVRQFKLALNIKTDADIINHLDSQDNKQGYVKDLIRADIKSTK